MKKKLFLLTLCVFLLCGCGKIPKLSNGEEAVVTLSDKQISVDELYKSIKNDFALNSLVNMIDKYILEKEFADYADTAKKEAESQIASLRENYKKESELTQAIQQYTGYSSIEAYQDYIYLTSLKDHATLEYEKTKVSEQQIKTYYKNQIYGDISINHILITSNAKSDATDDEKTAAETKAKNTVKEIIGKLKTAKSNKEDLKNVFASLAKEYSKDDATKNNSGALGFINYNNASGYDELFTAALKLKDGEYSTDVITSSAGYHVILRIESKDKDTLENKKTEIIEAIAKSAVADDYTIAVNAIEYYRKKYDMNITDDTLNSQYKKYMNNLMENAKTQNENASQN